jgi:hypothetical protein
VLPAAHGSIADSRPNKTYVPNGLAQTVVRSGDTVHIGGRFSRIGPRTGPGVELTLAGTEKDGMPEVTGGNGIIQAVAPDGTGGSFGGQFRHVGGIARRNIAHIRADHSVDPAFGPNPNDDVQAIVVSGSVVYFSGLFTALGGLTHNRREIKR